MLIVQRIFSQLVELAEIFVANEKQEMRIADFDAIAVLQFLFPGGLTVHKRAVQTIEVGDNDFTIEISETTMTPRDERIVDRHAVCRISTYYNFGVRERDIRSLERARNPD